MQKTFVLDLDDDTVKEAIKTANSHGMTMKLALEAIIGQMARSRFRGNWITETELDAMPGTPSRVSLNVMRKCNRLQEGNHYQRKGRFIFYDRNKVMDAFKERPLSKAATS